MRAREHENFLVLFCFWVQFSVAHALIPVHVNVNVNVNVNVR
jgi:hypothetical protein